MKLKKALARVAVVDRRGSWTTAVSGLSTDSRTVDPSEIFVAVPGTQHDGHDYIEAAVARGVRAVLAERWPGGEALAEVPEVALVPDARRAISAVASEMHGAPSRRLMVAGVTGTNGKTTVAHLLASMCGAAHLRSGVIGTLGVRIGAEQYPSSHTTPDAWALHGALAQMVRAGASHALLEVSSHALEQARVADVDFKVCGFTNLTQDHLDYHGDMERYFTAKAKLFKDCLARSRARDRAAVASIDGPYGTRMLELWDGAKWAVSAHEDESADIFVRSAELRLDGMEAELSVRGEDWTMASPLVGAHNLENIVVSVGMGLALGLPRVRILEGIASFAPPAGRLERVEGPKGTGFVDYAHTPDALARTLAALRKAGAQRIVLVFGCGGDRDRDKRAKMGAAAAAGADAVVITNDNPRSEPPETIAAEIEAGLKDAGWSREPLASGVPRSYEVVLDRASAIEQAVAAIGEAGIVLVAGKGHEAVQIQAGRSVPFSDRKALLLALGGEVDDADDGPGLGVGAPPVATAPELVPYPSAPPDEAAEDLSAKTITMTIDVDVPPQRSLDDILERFGVPPRGATEDLPPAAVLEASPADADAAGATEDLAPGDILDAASPSVDSTMGAAESEETVDVAPMPEGAVGDDASVAAASETPDEETVDLSPEASDESGDKT